MGWELQSLAWLDIIKVWPNGKGEKSFKVFYLPLTIWKVLDLPLQLLETYYQICWKESSFNVLLSKVIMSTHCCDWTSKCSNWLDWFNLCISAEVINKSNQEALFMTFNATKLEEQERSLDYSRAYW